VSALVETAAAGWGLEATGGGRSFGWWLRSLLSLAVAFGVIAVAMPIAFGGGARGAGVDPVQVFSSGSLISLETSGAGQLSIDGITPGQSRSQTVRISNPRSAETAVSLTTRIADRVGPGGTPLSSALVLRVERAGDSGAPIYAGPIGRMPRLGLGSIPAGAERAYRIAVTLPAEVGNEVAGASLSAGFVWAAA